MEALTKLNEIAEQLETWADESQNYGWSTHQVKPMRQKAIEIRSFVRQQYRTIDRAHREQARAIGE